MNRDNDVPWGGDALIVAGLLATASNLGWLNVWPRAVWTAALLLGGSVLATLGLSARDRWWALIPAGALLGAGGATLLQGAWGGAALLGGLGTGFLAAALRNRTHWWALIPAGALFSVTVMMLWPDRATGSWLLLGLALTFVLVALTGAPRRWALYPATTLTALWTLSIPAWASTFAVVWSAALIILGVTLLRARRAPPGTPGGRA